MRPPIHDRPRLVTSPDILNMLDFSAIIETQPACSELDPQCLRKLRVVLAAFTGQVIEIRSNVNWPRNPFE